MTNLADYRKILIEQALNAKSIKYTFYNSSESKIKNIDAALSHRTIEHHTYNQIHQNALAITTEEIKQVKRGRKFKGQEEVIGQ